MRFSQFFVLVMFSLVLFGLGTLQLQMSQSQAQVLLQLRKHLEYPSVLDILETYGGDLCNLSSIPQLTITCEDNSITELRITGDKHAKVSGFNGYAIPSKTLSEDFSMDSFVTTLTRLSSLKVLSLLSLGIWGSLPDKIHRLASIELLDLSSNFLYGTVPPQLSRLVTLQSLILDENFFNDTVPVWLDSLSSLTVLSLKNNQLRGQIPSSLCKVTTLTAITLSHNELSGKVPDFSTLSSLHVLDLRENHFDSQLPAMPKGLVTALLSRNTFSREIPEHFGQLEQLQHLDLSFNSLSGTPPSALFSLPKLTYLDIASNMLSGSLPSHLSCGRELGFVDISMNKFVGELPSCLGTISNERIVNVDGNCLSVDSKNQHQESFCKESHVRSKQSSDKRVRVVAGMIGGSIFLLVLFVLGVLALCRRCRLRRKTEQHMLLKGVQDNQPTGVSAEILANARLISQTVKLGTQGVPVHRMFSLEELKEATNNFNELMFMGEGSIGKMYKGRIESGIYVAIRSIAVPRKYSSQNLKLQLDFLSKLRHPHLVGLLGHCIDGGSQDNSYASRIFLIYEYVPNGNYRSHLSENRPEKVLKWSDRLAILIGAAKAVHFLHTGVIPGSFNNLLRTNNILLDEHHVAKLSDYGMSIFKEETEKHEAKGQTPQSWQMSKQKDDVYNFGFILLESLVGPIVTGKGETFLLNEMASFGSQDGRRRIVDPIVLISSSQESLSIVISITNKCISSESSARPSFEDVLWNLQYAAQVQATADADQKSDSTSQS